MVDRIEAGVDAGSLDAVELMRSRVGRGQQVYVQQKVFLDNVRKLHDDTGRPIIGTYPKSTTGNPPPPPPGYVEIQIGMHKEPVLKDFAPVLKAMTKPSFLRDSLTGKLILETRGVGKHLLLGFDTYHMVRLGAYSVASKISTGNVPTVNFRKGVTILDNSVKELQAKAAAGQIDPKSLPEVLEQKRILDLGIKTGFNVNRFLDAYNQHWTEHLPVTGHFQKFLFNTFQRGAMADVYVKAFDAYKKQMPKATEAAIARKLSKDLNDVFGTRGRQGWVKSRSGQDILQILFLAPQWTEGRVMTDMKAVRGVGKAAFDLMRGKRPEVNMQSRVVGTLILTYVLANQVINNMTTGHSTFENERGHKLDAFIPDEIGGGPGYWLNPTANAEEVFHAMHKSMEREGGDVLQAWWDFLNGRLSTLTRPLGVAITGRKYGIVGPYVKELDGKSAPYGGPSGYAKGVAAAKQIIQPPIGSAETADLLKGTPDDTTERQMLARFGVRVDPNIDDREKTKGKKKKKKFSVFEE